MAQRKVYRSEVTEPVYKMHNTNSIIANYNILFQNFTLSIFNSIKERKEKQYRKSRRQEKSTISWHHSFYTNLNANFLHCIENSPWHTCTCILRHCQSSLMYFCISNVNLRHWVIVKIFLILRWTSITKHKRLMSVIWINDTKDCQLAGLNFCRLLYFHED